MGYETGLKLPGSTVACATVQGVVLLGVGGLGGVGRCRQTDTDKQGWTDSCLRLVRYCFKLLRHVFIIYLKLS